MAGKTSEGWKLAERLGRHHVYVRREERTNQWSYSLVRMPEGGLLATAGPGENPVGDFKSRNAALQAARRETARQGQGRKLGEKK